MVRLAVLSNQTHGLFGVYPVETRVLMRPGHLRSPVLGNIAPEGLSYPQKNEICMFLGHSWVFTPKVVKGNLHVEFSS